MNRITKYILTFAATIVGLTSCETYGEPTHGSSSIGPVMSGYWVGGVLSDNETGAVEATGVMFNTYETADKSPDKMWLWINYIDDYFPMRAKVTIDVATLTIVETEGKSTLDVDGEFYDFKILSGKVEKNAHTTQTGGKADRITVIYTYQAPEMAGRTIKLVAWRDTLWPGDYE